MPDTDSWTDIGTVMDTPHADKHTGTHTNTNTRGRRLPSTVSTVLVTETDILALTHVNTPSINVLSVQ